MRVVDRVVALLFLAVLAGAPVLGDRLRRRRMARVRR